MEKLTRLLAHLPIQERSQAAEARRIAIHLANKLGLSEEQAGKVGVVVTEAATNMLKHARGSEILLSSSGSSLQMLAIDRGPGMNVAACLRDGYSTSGTAGSGLGAMKRLSDSFDIFSNHTGTVVWAEFGPHTSGYGAARVPFKGEQVCGDAWSIVEKGGAVWILVADGLGHGEFAALAADRAVQAFENSRFDTVTGVMEEIHSALRATRGAAVAIAEVRNSVVNYCGLGNISGVLHSGTSNIHLVSFSGTAGVEARKIGSFTYTWRPGAIMVMHSDGLQSQWGLEGYPGVIKHNPAIIAGLLYRDYSRGRDDVTVLAVRQ
ncbi:MAG TPA: ATP-binding protein [Bryobacteraceae bacterium]|nr:ATP-binding protein [Bryobacteraceae bacterium]